MKPDQMIASFAKSFTEDYTKAMLELLDILALHPGDKPGAAAELLALATRYAKDETKVIHRHVLAAAADHLRKTAPH